MGLVVDCVRVIELAVVPQHLAQRRVGLGHGEHLLRVAALGHQLPAKRRERNKFKSPVRWNSIGHGGQADSEDMRFSRDGTCDRARLADVSLSLQSL